MVTPRWLRERRRAERDAARPDVLAARVARQIGVSGPTSSLQEIMRRQGVESIRDWSRFGEPVPDEVWDPFFAAIMEAKGR